MGYKIEKSSDRRGCDDTEQVPGYISGRKAASGIPKAVLQEPKLFCQKILESIQQPEEFLFRAVDADLLGLPAVQGEHAHEGGGVDLEPVAAYIEFYSLPGCQRHKILDVPQ